MRKSWDSKSTGWSSVPTTSISRRSPLAGQLDAETYVLGAFNPGLTRLANGNLLMMVRVAEALRQPIVDGHVHAIRWTMRTARAMSSTPGRSNSSTPPIRASSCCAAAAGRSWR